MQRKRVISKSIFAIAMIMSIVSLYMFSTMTRSGATIVKNAPNATAETSLTPVTYNGENMYVAKSSFYDYYSDSQIGTGATPNTITDALNTGKNTFGQFNKKLLELMKYGDTALCPAKYPLYQGRQGVGYPDLLGVYTAGNEAANAKSNYWLGANNNQIGAYATQGLVDSKLSYDANGVSYVTQSNPENGKSAYLPYFDKKFLTTNKYNNSGLSLGSVIENVSFPFRKTDKGGVTYYEFDSRIDTVRFNANNQLDYLGQNNASEQVKDAQRQPGFFPYNKNSDSTSNRLNYAMGTKIEVPFLTTRDGKIDGKDIIFEFTGDDDVWVFIDGILALDMGGAHPKVSGQINFADKTATVSGVKNNKVAFATRCMTGFGTGIYNNASLNLVNVPATYANYKTPFSAELKNKLENTSEVHTLTFFYMERGMDVANMKLNFNLPEPSKFTLATESKTDTVGDTFKEETSKVAKDDEFVYDVVDTTKKKASEMCLKSKESVTYSNEFDLKDRLVVQQKGLKNSSRKMNDLYEASWTLADLSKEISKGKGLVLDDSRVAEKNVLFKNADNDEVPIVTASYVNQPKVGKYTLTCVASDKLKEANTAYKNVNFKYLIIYSNVFGGKSTEQKYVGQYTVYGENDENGKVKTTRDGMILLKPGEKAIIDKIPAYTVVNVKWIEAEGYNISKVRATGQFKYDKETFVTTGKIDAQFNDVEYVMGNKDEKTVVEVIGDKKDNKTDKVKEEEKLVQLKGGNELDDTVKTGDETDIRTWLIIMVVSLALTAGSAISLVASRTKKYDRF